MIQAKVIVGLIAVISISLLFGLWQHQKAKTARAEVDSVKTTLNVAVDANTVYTKVEIDNVKLGTKVLEIKKAVEKQRIIVKRKIEEVKTSGDQREKDSLKEFLSPNDISIYNANLDGVHDDQVHNGADKGKD